MPIFVPKRDVNWEWRRLHNEELHSLYRSPNIFRVIRRLRWSRSWSQSALKFLTSNPTVKRRLGRPRRRWKENIRMDRK